MPYYDYECKSCGHEFETFQSMSDAPLQECPECRKESLRRLIGGGSGVIFKGSGFYINDSRKKSGGDQGGGTKNGSSQSSPAASSAK